MLKFQKLWNNHPFPKNPCNKALFANQCAIRMSVALEKSGVDTSSFDKRYPKRRCYPALKHSPAHMLAAAELADWMVYRSQVFGERRIVSGVGRAAHLSGKKGILFIQNGWGNTDHIDLWNGEKLKAGDNAWLDYGEELWFWEVSL